MGCTATSIYGDQVIGKIYYPQEILNDLTKRDFSKPYPIPNQILLSLPQKIHSIYGFTQSFSQAYAFSTLIDNHQYLVYNNGRFVIKIMRSQLIQGDSQKSTPKMSILPHEDQICVMDVNQNMCAVGLSGGKLMLWDLKFNEMKIQIYLPKPSSSFSSISLTKKYIFVTDTTLPNNIAYCFDIQTTKLKGSIIINSMEPTLKGMRFKQNQHVVISAQGLWFIRYSTGGQMLQATKGMFTTFPKTSQCCITSINEEYLVSGGVDGYIYVWNGLYQCIKVIKCFEQQMPITAIAFSKPHNTLILGSLAGKIKCYSFAIKQKNNKNNYEESTEGESNAKEEDVEYLLTEALDEDFAIQSLLPTHQDTLLYFSFHCRGTLTSHLLPSTEPYPVKIRHLNHVQHMKLSRKADVYLSSSIKSGQSSSSALSQDLQVVNFYPSRVDEFNVDKLSLSHDGRWLKLNPNSVIKTSEINREYINLYSYSQHHHSVAFISENFLVVYFEAVKTQQLTMREQFELANNQTNEIKHLQLMELPEKSFLVSINYLQTRVDLPTSSPILVYLFITFQDQCFVFETKTRKEYNLHTSVKFLKNKFNPFKIHPHSNLTNQGKNLIEIHKDLIKEKPKLNKSLINQENSQTEKAEKLLKQEGKEETVIEVEFDEELKVWRQTSPIDQQNITTEIVEKNQTPSSNSVFTPHSSQILNKIHCSYLKASHSTLNHYITIGGSSIIFWKNRSAASNKDQHNKKLAPI